MIVIVRPQQSLQKSVDCFRKHNIECRGFAVQTIDTSNALTKNLNADIARFQQTSETNPGCLFDTAIVTSQYAAKVLIEQLTLNNCRLDDFTRRLIAVGYTTAEQLRGFAEEVPIITPQRQDSEGILTLPELNTVSDQRIAIIKGIGGRELLASALLSKAAIVSEYSLYQRRKLGFDVDTLFNESEPVDLVVVTSGEAASILLDNPKAAHLKQLSWLVISQRVATLVKQQGVSSVYISAGASDAALIKCTQEIME